MLKNIKMNKILWFIVAILSLISGVIGVFYSDIYSKVVSREVISGMISQDIITILSSIIILFLIFKINEKIIIKSVIIIALISYFFYGYGIYVIERIYNPLYFVYMAIFGLSFYSIIYSLVNLKTDYLEKIKVTKMIKYISIGFSFFIPLIFYPLWISQLLPLIRAGEKQEFLYSIPILDLCFIMPAFIIIAVLTINNKGLGILFTPALFIHGFTLLFSVGLGGMISPLYNQSAVLTENLFYLGLSTIFIVLAFLYFRNMNYNNGVKYHENK